MTAVSRPELSVVVPCLNEEANVRTLGERVFGALDRAGITSELVLVDDGSTDGTWDVMTEMANRSGSRVRPVRHGENLGIAEAWRTGLKHADGNLACLIDADLQNPPEEIVTLFRRLGESHADIAQGTRSTIERLRDSRLIASRTLNTLLNVVFRMRARDSKSGFVLGPRSVLIDVVEHQRRYRFFQTFISVAARAKGYSILEVETLFQNRNAGESFINQRGARVSIAALADFPTAFSEFGRRRHPHGASVGPRTSAPTPQRHPYRGMRRARFEVYFGTMPIHTWLISSRARDLYLDLKRCEYAGKDELAALQLAKLQRLLQHVRVHTPYYRELMRSCGVGAEDIRDLDDLQKLPLLSKEAVRESLYFGLFSDTHRKREMHRIATSGSTGEPFVTYADKYQLEMRFATTLRALEWTGWRFGDRQARLWHQTLGMTRRQIFRERTDAWMMRRIFIPAFEISSDTLETYVSRIREHRPVLVDGYAESLNFLATYVREGGVPGFSPRAIVSSAQTLPSNVRDVIEDAFSTRVYDKYGSREFSGIAYTCEASRDHHVMDESYIVELLVDGRPAKPGETGEVVITDLNNFSVPLIRYRIGDLAVAVDSAAPCACGRSHSRIGAIEGRTQAIIHCADGRWLPGAFFSHFFKEYEFAVRHFQVHQSEAGSFTVRYVRGRQFTDKALREIIDRLQGYTGTGTQIEALEVGEIPLLRTGKRSPVVSEVPTDFQALRSPDKRRDSASN